MNTLMRDMPLFVAVAKQKNFSQAAETLGLAVSTLSRRVTLLEKEMGVSLFLRNTRNVELTPSGQVLFERCQYILTDADDAYELVTSNMSAPSGTIRIAVHPDIYHSDHMSEALTEFAVRWPGISLRISISERHADMVKDPLDLDIQGGPLLESTQKARKVFTIRPALYASAKLLETHPLPLVPQDIQKLPCISLATWGSTWSLYKENRAESVEIRPGHIATTRRVCYDFVMAGLGVSLLSPSLAEHAAAKDVLVRLLPGWHAAPADIFLIMANSQIPRRIRLLIDHLVAHFDCLPQ